MTRLLLATALALATGAARGAEIDWTPFAEEGVVELDAHQRALDAGLPHGVEEGGEGRLGIHDDGAPPGQEHGEVRAQAGLNLDNLRPHQGQPLGDVCAGPYLGEVDYSDAFHGQLLQFILLTIISR